MYHDPILSVFYDPIFVPQLGCTNAGRSGARTSGSGDQIAPQLIIISTTTF